MAELTKAQLKTLADIARWPTVARVRFPTGEALRRAGMVTRYTVYAVGADFANRDGVHEQWRGEPKAQHEWDLTSAGRRALEERS